MSPEERAARVCDGFYGLTIEPEFRGRVAQAIRDAQMDIGSVGQRVVLRWQDAFLIGHAILCAAEEVKAQEAKS
jgi:hypothetical protein